MGRLSDPLRRVASWRLSSEAAIRRWPPGDRVTDSVPCASHRRRVSTLTPRDSAASPIRTVGSDVLLLIPMHHRHSRRQCLDIRVPMWTRCAIGSSHRPVGGLVLRSCFGRRPTMIGASSLTRSAEASTLGRLSDRRNDVAQATAQGTGTREDPWVLKTPSGSSEYIMYRDESSDP